MPSVDGILGVGRELIIEIMHWVRQWQQLLTSGCLAPATQLIPVTAGRRRLSRWPDQCRTRVGQGRYSIEMHLKNLLNVDGALAA